MVVLEAFGLAAAEMWNYNRDMYKFDQEQRLERDMKRVEMQIKRFDLFREDIADLVELTVSKMDMYHMVGALMLAFTCTIYTEGLFRGIEPPWFTGLYYMSVCNSFVYLLLAVWLSMHASVQAQSYGVRLRTRYVRLPIPSLAFLNDLTARFSDFERQGAGNVMRLPFSGVTQNWKRREQLNTDGQPAVRRPAEWHEKDAADQNKQEVMHGTQSGELIGRGDDGFGKEDILKEAAASVPGRHVQLFRRLQAKWQCYDAYARVSMSIGVNQMIQSVNYFVLGATLIERTNPSTAIACTIIFQVVAVGLTLLDIAEKPIAKCLPLSRTLQIFVLQGVGSAPVLISMFMLIFARKKESISGPVDPYAFSYFFSPACYFLEAMWFQLILIAAWPSRDEATLPRKFLAVLFLDVFGDAVYDPTEAEQAPVTPSNSPAARDRARQETHIASAEGALLMAQAALRRWEAVPHELLSDNMAEQLDQLRRDYTFWRQRLQAYISRRKLERGVVYDPASRDQQELKPWADLSSLEKQEDPFSGALIGPLTKRRTLRTSKFFYDLDLSRHILDSSDGRPLLTLHDLSAHVDCVKVRVRNVLSKADSASGGGDADDGEETDDEDVPAGRASDPLSGSRQKNSGKRKERLPWKTIRRLTHVLQVAWLFLGVQLAMQSAGLWGIDWMYGYRERRLMGAPDFFPEPNFEVLESAWPHGGFFRPTALSCLPPASPDGASRLLVGSPYAVFRAAAGVRGSHSPPLAFVALPRTNFPAGTVAFCEDSLLVAPASTGCLLGSLMEEGIAVWHYGGPRADAVILAFERGRPWQSFAGALMRCDDLAVQAAVPRAGAERCLVLVGWDGERLPLAVIPLSNITDLRTGIPSGAAVRPRADAPLPTAVGEGAWTVAALHLQPLGGRLRALLRRRGAGVGAAAAEEELHSWSLLGEPRALGGRRPPWAGLPQRAASKPARGAALDGTLEVGGLCEGSSGDLFVAGLRRSAGPGGFGDERPELLRFATEGAAEAAAAYEAAAAIVVP